MTDSQCTLQKDEGVVLNCKAETDIHLCRSLTRNVTDLTAPNGTTVVYGECKILQDGYYSVGLVCFMLGLAMLVFFIKKETLKLERLPENAWRLKKQNQSPEEIPLSRTIRNRQK